MFLFAVVEDNPAADYDTITKLVQEKWSRLSDTNKQHFCLVGKDELEVLKKTVLEKKKLSQKIRSKPAVQVSTGPPHYNTPHYNTDFSITCLGSQMVIFLLF